MAERVEQAEYPEHLANERVTMGLAAKLSGITVPGLMYAIKHGKLRALRFPAGQSLTNWQVRIADLADYTRRPLSAEWLEVVEQSLRPWEPGEGARHVA